MRVFIAVIVLIFSFQSWTKADDISDFEIEGISIGDSLLNYFDQEQIETKKKNGFIYPNKDFYSATFKSSKFKNYDRVQIHLKANDKKYIIHSVGGKILYPNNISKCYQDMDSIISEIKLMFVNPEIINVGTSKHSIDKTGKSTSRIIFIDLSSSATVESAIVVECTDWSKEMRHIDQLTISIDSKEFDNWINNVAYN